MASLPEQVQPGDLISAELMNDFLEELRALREAVDQLGGPAAGVPVPSFLGRSFAEVQSILNQPARQLALGEVFETTGARLDPHHEDTRYRIVLFQEPVARINVMPNTAVDVVVSSQETSDNDPPVINELRKLSDNTVSDTFRVGDSMLITGLDFETQNGLTSVSFEGKTVALEGSGNSSQQLHVKVPDDFDGAPKESDQKVDDVKIVVETPYGSDSIFCTIKGPSETPPPRISTDTDDLPNPNPPNPKLGEDVTIVGSGFSSIPEENRVVLFSELNEIEVEEVKSASNTEIVFSVPSGISWVNPRGTTVDIKITVNDQTTITDDTQRLILEP